MAEYCAINFDTYFQKKLLIVCIANIYDLH